MKLTNQQLKSVPFQYAQDVLDGKIVVGLRIKQAVQRFYKWIETADADGFYLDHKKGMMAINFFPTLLNHTKGSMVGQPFTLAPFQQFSLYNIFAWLNKETKYRRIRKVYDKRGRGNGKTAEMAGICLLMQSFEQESESEVYIAATKEAQAKICWTFAKNYIEHPMANPMLKQLGFYCKQREIIFKPLVSSMMPLGGDSKTQDGLSAHFVVIDEYHAHPSDALKEVLESSMLKRSQPLTYQITTAGFNTSSVCKHYEDMCIDVLNEQKKDDTLFIMMHDLDEGDDWQDQSNWKKANPLWDYGLNTSELVSAYSEAVNQPSKIPNFKTKHLNMWVDSPQIWIPSEVWNRNIVNVKDYEKLFKEKALEFGCFSGSDLSTRVDLSAHVLLTNPDNEGNRYLMPHFFCPKNTIDARSKEDRVPYRYWSDNGFLNATPGDRIDYDVFKDTIRTTNEAYQVIRHGFDPWNATSTINDLIAEGFDNISEFSQAIGVINHPTKQFEILVYDGKIKHNGHPVFSWMLSGCVLYEDANGNIKVHKGRSHEGNKRVDGVIAGIIALGESLTPEDVSEQSQYNDPDKEITFGI